MKWKKLKKALEDQKKICEIADEDFCKKCMENNTCIGVIELYHDDIGKIVKQLKKVYKQVNKRNSI